MSLSPFEDSFKDYTLDQTINGQGSWTGYANSKIVNEDCVTNKCVKVTGTPSGGNIIKSGTALDIGRWNWYIKLASTTDRTTLPFETQGYGVGNPPLKVLFYYWTDIPAFTGNIVLATGNAIANWTVLVTDPVENQWYNIDCEWDLSDPVDANKTIRCRVDSGEFTDWKKPYYATADYIQTFNQSLNIVGDSVDDIAENYTPPSAELEITYPETGSQMGTSTISLIGNYNLKGEDWNRIMLIFEQWNASSTCPTYGNEEWQTEINQGWFIWQSFPYFSSIFETGTTSTDDFSVEVDDLRLGNYNCVECYFINEISGNLSSQKCTDYTLEIITPITPEIPLKIFIKDYEDYFSEFESAYATPTDLFIVITGYFKDILNQFSDYISYMRERFDLDEANEKGFDLGSSIPTAFGFLTIFDWFFGGISVSNYLAFYLIIWVILIVIKLIFKLKSIIK